MKKIFSLLFVSAFLASCTVPFFNKASNTPQDGDTVSVHYVGTNDDGTEFDSSRQEGRTPLEFVIGTSSMIAGFENAVREMKVGEKKVVRLEAKDAYGEEYIEETKPLSEYSEVITQTVPANALTGDLEQKVPQEQAQQLFGSVEVWTEKKIGDASLKIISATGTEVLISINDPKAPFYGKKIETGMKTTAQDGSEITVTGVEGENVNIDIKPKQEVISKTDTEITLKVKNPHPLAGKALNFEIELLGITNKATAE